MALQICLALSVSNHNSCIKFLSSTKTLLSISVTKPSFSYQKCNPRYRNADNKESVVQLSPFLSRRQLSFSSFVPLLYGLYPEISKASLPEDVELERYTDSKEGFTLLKPSSWIKVGTLYVCFGLI